MEDEAKFKKFEDLVKKNNGKSANFIFYLAKNEGIIQDKLELKEIVEILEDSGSVTAQDNKLYFNE